MVIDLRFDGKVIVITGAGSGMGLLASQKFAESGAHVAMLDVNEEAIKREAQKINDAGYSALPILCNVREYEQIKSAVDKAYNAFGRIDATVSFAGGNAERICRDVSDFDIERIETIDWGLEVNFRAPIYMAKAAFGYMKAQKSGVIVNIGSIDGVTGCNSPTYGPSKTGLLGLTKSVARQGAKYGVRSVCVSPGPVLTRPEMANMKTMLGYAAEPIEIVEVILYLCSERARSITGSNFLIDGGRACMVGM